MIKSIEKVVVSCGFGKMEKESEAECLRVLLNVTGQRPIPTKARKSVSNFHVRRGMKSGMKVTLRGNTALRFLHKIVTFVLPGYSDFKGFPQSCVQGNVFNFGLTKLHTFPEIDETKLRGFNVCLVSKRGKDSLIELLEKLNVPINQG